MQYLLTPEGLVVFIDLYEHFKDRFGRSAAVRAYDFLRKYYEGEAFAQVSA